MITTLKPGTAVQHDLEAILQGATQQLSPTSPILQLLQALTAALRRGADVTVLAHDLQLTPNEAAAMVGISRPHLLTFMNSGALAFTRVGTHRRIKVTDLLDFNERRQAALHKLADARTNTPAAERHHPNNSAPLSDTALADLDSL